MIPFVWRLNPLHQMQQWGPTRTPALTLAIRGGRLQAEGYGVGVMVMHVIRGGRLQAEGVTPEAP